jgi:hypothetical protein
MKRSKYEVVVGNIGTVYSGTSKSDTAMTWMAYVDQSKSARGRAANEPVTMFCDGEIVKEYYPEELSSDENFFVN